MYALGWMFYNPWPLNGMKGAWTPSHCSSNKCGWGRKYNANLPSLDKIFLYTKYIKKKSEIKYTQNPKRLIGFRLHKNRTRAKWSNCYCKLIWRSGCSHRGCYISLGQEDHWCSHCPEAWQSPGGGKEMQKPPRAMAKPSISGRPCKVWPAGLRSSMWTGAGAEGRGGKA